MSDTLGLQRPAMLNIRGGGSVYHGGNQAWYPQPWQRQAGCGPTACANLLWYLVQTRPGTGVLCPWDASQKTGFLRLMEDVWRYVTPGSMGVNTTAIFTGGARRYGEERGVPLLAQDLTIPPLQSGARSWQKVAAFVGGALGRNLPVAFLNLSNGSLHNLDSWHWVTLVALRGEEAQIHDQGRSRWVALRQWLATSLIGGGFVTVGPAPGP